MRIVIIGAGRLASHLGPAFAKKGCEVQAVYNRHFAKAKHLAGLINPGTIPVASLEDLPRSADLYVLAVADQAIGEVAAQLHVALGSKIPVVHTSGATPATILATHFDQFGIFYPLQTFSEGQAVDFSNIPICLYSNSSELQQVLATCAKKLSQQVFFLDDEQRGQLHLAAVFANNFVNHILGISHQILDEAEIPRNILFNLIRATINKLEIQDAKVVQTGPAARGDEPTLNRHEALLADNPEWRTLYHLISQQIQNQR